MDIKTNLSRWQKNAIGFSYAGGQKKRKKRERERMSDGLNSNFAPAVFPADILYDANLDSSERLVLLILFTYTNSHTNTAFPSYQTISERAAISRRSAIRIVERLIEKGYIVKQKNFRESKTKGKIEQTSNLFTLFFQTRKGNEPQKGSDRMSPPLVTVCHQGSDRMSPPLVTICHQGSDRMSPELSNELSIVIEEEDKLKKFGKTEEKNDEVSPENTYSYLATREGATDQDLFEALKKMDQETNVENPVAWLTVAIRREKLNRELASRKRNENPVPNRKTKTAAERRESKDSRPEKYEKFYL